MTEDERSYFARRAEAERKLAAAATIPAAAAAHAALAVAYAARAGISIEKLPANT